ncbi:holliday junction resolvase [Mycobacterium phage Nanosmite]|nr:holliday junction resolvase [Mycobacterium phage Nanosmite]
MARNRKSAKAAGARFEAQIAEALRNALGDPNIQRAPRWGAVDKGDIVNVRIDGHDLVIQTKDVTRLDLPKGVGDAKVQAVNAGALAGLFIHKRHGVGDPMKQWVSCTVAELVALITKVPVHPGAEEGIEGRAV